MNDSNDYYTDGNIYMIGASSYGLAELEAILWQTWAPD